MKRQVNTEDFRLRLTDENYTCKSYKYTKCSLLFSSACMALHFAGIFYKLANKKQKEPLIRIVNKIWRLDDEEHLSFPLLCFVAIVHFCVQTSPAAHQRMRIKTAAVCIHAFIHQPTRFSRWIQSDYFVKSIISLSL